MWRLRRVLRNSGVRCYENSNLTWQRPQSRTLVIDNGGVNPTQHAEYSHIPLEKPKVKRFWKSVGLETYPGHFTITLDKRVLKTPEKNLLTIPSTKKLLAALVVNEWENQDHIIKHHALPLTSLVSLAIDRFSDPGGRYDGCMDLLRYLNTDTICFKEDYPPRLVELQTKHWDPLLEWTRTEFNVSIRTFDSLFIHSQPPETRETFERVLRDMDQWTFAAMHRAVYSTKSFIIALALVKGRITAEEAALASRVEVQSQINRWGEVEDTHDVDYRDIRHQLATVMLLVSNV